MGIRIAVVHEWLTSFAGSERVLDQILAIYPDADLFCVCDFLRGSDRAFLAGRNVTTTFVQKLPGARRHYRKYLPLMPLAIEQLDLTKYDLVISSSHAVAKGVLTGPSQLHISYVHSPIRYAWDLQHVYLRESGLESGLKSWLSRALLHKMRIWDTRTANGVDHFMANSKFIGRRIHKAYGRSSEVVYPPVDVTAFALREQKEDFYVTASRMVPYKRMDLIVDAFTQMPDKRLVVIGAGPEFGKIEAKAGKNVKLLGHQPGDVLIDYIQRARAFIFAAEEDFGITPVEAQACGTPVIAFGRGGATETVVGSGGADVQTGIFFSEQNVHSIIDAVGQFERESESIMASTCRMNALRFSEEKFRHNFTAAVDRQWLLFQKSSGVQA
jgi:glycosyltransferase involved in cell wall biosynthesis